jgi:ATP-dependent Clp protease ATP-binding subunit ClpC
LAKHGYDIEFGARPLRRLIQTSIEDRLSDAVLAGDFETGQHVLIDVTTNDEGQEEIILLNAENNEAVPLPPAEEAFPA